MSRLSRPAWRWVPGAAVLGVVLLWTGTGPFVAGLRSLDAATLALGTGIAVPTTVACAWRWHLVASGLGVGVPLGQAVASCYRAQFLNVTLPGGILGDVHRGVRHGRAAGDTGRGVRAVVWERFAGQAVLIVVTAAALVRLAPGRWWAPAALGLLLSLLALVLLVRRVLRATRSPVVGRMAGAIGDDLRCALLGPRTWPRVVLASTVAVAGHLATYLVAARAVGVPVAAVTLAPLALLVLLAAGLPTNVAGWGPREGMAAWVFGAAGLGSGQGVATAVAYGAMVLVASLPGAAVLVVAAVRPAPARPVRPATPQRARAAGQGAGHG